MGTIVHRRQDWPSLPIIPQRPSGFTIEAGTLQDAPFIDQMQKLFKGHLGFLYSGTIERKIEAGDVLVARDGNGVQFGFVMGTKSYDRNDAVSRIDQIAVVPIKQRKQLGSALLAEWVRRLPYGVTLICCWCAQDLRENRFWEAEGFLPIAFRAGGQSMNRVHIFWQRRVRRGDTATAFWYPKETSNGAMAAARLILPIPLGTDWAEVEFPRILPTDHSQSSQRLLPNGLPDPRQLPGKTATTKRAKRQLTPAEYEAEQRARNKHLQERRPPGVKIFGESVYDAQQQQREAPPKPKPEKKPRPRNAAEHVAAARELRDRFLEHVNALQLEEAGKYDPTRLLEEAPSCMSEKAAQLMSALGGMTSAQESPPLRLVDNTATTGTDG